MIAAVLDTSAVLALIRDEPGTDKWRRMSHVPRSRR